MGNTLRGIDLRANVQLIRQGLSGANALFLLFAAGQEFTYGIEEMARYYRTYLDLMRHWDAVLPGKVLRALHEDVVENLEVTVRYRQN